MITLHLGMGEGDVAKMTFDNHTELTNYIEKDIASYNFKCVWLITDNGCDGEIFITEHLTWIIALLNDGYLYELDDNNVVIHMHEYSSYEDAYKVATDMREGNPLCYDS